MGSKGSGSQGSQHVNLGLDATIVSDIDNARLQQNIDKLTEWAHTVLAIVIFNQKVQSREHNSQNDAPAHSIKHSSTRQQRHYVEVDTN